MSPVALIIVAVILSLTSAAGCALIYLRASRKKEHRARRLDTTLGAFQGGKSTAQKGPSQHLTGLRLAFFLRIIGYRSRSRAHRKSGLARILLPTFAVGLVAGFLTLKILSFFMAVLVFFAAWLGSARYVLARIDNAYTQKLFAQLPDALGMIVRTLRVGVPLSRALIVVSNEAEEPTASEFRDLVTDAEIGRDLSDALRALADRTRLQDYRYFSTVMSLQSQTGGTLADVLAGLADIIRQRIALRKRGHALSGEARLSSYVIGGLPFFLAVVLHFANPQYFGVFLETHAGHMMLAAAGTLLAIGLFSIRFLMKRMLG